MCHILIINWHLLNSKAKTRLHCMKPLIVKVRPRWIKVRPLWIKVRPPESKVRPRKLFGQKSSATLKSQSSDNWRRTIKLLFIISFLWGHSLLHHLYDVTVQNKTWFSFSHSVISFNKSSYIYLKVNFVLFYF